MPFATFKSLRAPIRSLQPNRLEDPLDNWQINVGSHVAFETRKERIAADLSAEINNISEANMQSDEQPTIGSNDQSQATTVLGWPPSFLRLCLGALVAAGLCFAVFKAIYPFYVVPPEIAILPDATPLPLQLKLEKEQFLVDEKNYTILFAIMGAILGTVCVLFTFGFRSFLSILIAAVFSAALGGVGGNRSNWTFNNLRETSGTDLVLMGFALDGMKQTILGYALIWGLIGLGVGLGIGSFRGFGKSLVGGIAGFVGGVIAAMLYVLGVAQISIGTTMNTVLPGNDTSLAIWIAFFSLAIASCIALGLGERKRKV